MSADPPVRVRREPPPFRRGVVARTERRSPHLVRVTLRGPELGDFEPPLPAGSVRLLLPDAAGAELVMPVWNGNAFFHVDGRRPVIRTLTPLRHDAGVGELDVDVVLHGDGPLSAWAAATAPGAEAAVSGPGRGYSFQHGVTAYVLAGDESALPAIGQLVDALPPGTRATVIVEIAHPDARVDVGERDGIEVRWVERPAGGAPGSALVSAVAGLPVPSGAAVWAAGEAAAMQHLRGHPFGTAGVNRARATVRGYWKHGRSSTGDDT